MRLLIDLKFTVHSTDESKLNPHFDKKKWLNLTMIRHCSSLLRQHCCLLKNITRIDGQRRSGIIAYASKRIVLVSKTRSIIIFCIGIRYQEIVIKIVEGERCVLSRPLVRSIDSLMPEIRTHEHSIFVKRITSDVILVV